MAIYFYRVNERYGCFSNFSLHGFQESGKYWSTSEHYFQSKKFEGTQYEEQTRLASTPMEAARLGRDKTKPLRYDWEKVKVQVMEKAVFLKFNSHSDIREVLLSTGNEEIIEKTSNDYFWGCGEDGSGVNMLGKILMNTREKLRYL